MIPNSIAALTAFLLLVAPGMVWQFQQARYRPTVKETVLVEAARVVLASLVATGASAALLFWVWVPLYHRAQDAGTAMFDAPADAVPYVLATAATSFLACGLTLIRAAFKWPGRPPINRGRAWNQTFVDRLPEGVDRPRLIVELLDGTVWRGALQSFDTDPEDAHRCLVLGGTVKRKKPDDEGFEKKGDEGRFVILPESQIVSIQVVYAPTSNTPVERSESRFARVSRRLLRT